MRGWKKVLIIVVGAVVLLSIGKDLLIKTTITTLGSSIIGAPVKLGHFSLGIITRKVHLKNFKIYNPDGFPQDEPLLHIPEIKVQADVASFFSGKIHLPLVVVDVKQMTIIKNKEGKLNVDSLKVAKAGDKKSGAQESSDMPIQIDLLKLNVGEVIVKDYTKGEPPMVQAYPAGINNQEFKNITSVQALTALIMMEAMGPTALKSAGMYTAATVLGVGFLPAGVAGVLIGKDSAEQEFSVSGDKVYKTVLKLVGEIGEMVSENKDKQLIKAKVSGADVNIRLEQPGPAKTIVKVSARQMMIPKPAVAGGVLHQLSEKLK